MQSREGDTYIVAVSGGVDSMALLDMLAKKQILELRSQTSEGATQSKTQDLRSKISFVVAHFDHGIRKDSASDEEFVRAAAEKYGLAYESVRAELGVGASEEQARKMRYNFLRQVCKKYNAPLVTAHHQDDLVETMVINLLRGTGWRGLVPMEQVLDFGSWISDIPSSKHGQRPTANGQRILRPLLNMSKAELLKYARTHNLEWREDSTNSNTAYLRNYVRLELLPQMLQKDPHLKQKLLDIYNKMAKLKNEIATELQNLIIKYQISNIKYCAPRYTLIMYPPPVASELIYHLLTQLDPDWHPNRLQITRALHFIKTGQAGKWLEISKNLKLELSAREVRFLRRDSNSKPQIPENSKY